MAVGKPSSCISVMSYSCFLLLLFLHEDCVQALRASYDDDPEFRLTTRLINDYKKRAEVRPVANQDDPLIVTFDLAYSQLVDLDGKNQILTSNVWVRQKWTNSKVSWNTSEYGNITTVMMSPDYFWKPDIVLYNTIEGGGEMYKFDTKIMFHADGLTEWYAPAQIKTICTIDITYFPFDEQKCNITFGSWSYTKSVLDLRLARDTADLDRYTASGEWKLISLHVVKNAVKYTCCEDLFVDVTYVVHVQRRVLFYLNNIIIPCIILNLMTLLAFLLPHDSGERISLVITILLGLTVYMLIFTENIPNSSVVIPIIGKFSMACFVEISLCLLVTTFTSRCYFHGVDRDMPKWFRYLIFNIMAPAFFISTPDHDARFSTEEHPMQIPLLKSCPNGHGPPDGRASSLQSRSTSYLKQAVMQNVMEQREARVRVEADPRIDRILEIMETYDEEKQQHKMDEAKRAEWHFVAVILDRFFFILFGVTITVSVISFYMEIPPRS